MSKLILAADCAYPFDYSRLPRRVKVIMGYVGSPTGTPNVWTQSEVDTARASGRAWVPIWTPADPRLDGQLGHQAANQMIAALAGYQGLEGCPVFLDIEHSVYVADQAGADAAVAAWTGDMHRAGHHQAWPYVPWVAGYGWVANWTGTRPRTLPEAFIGWQYAGGLDGDRYDLSVVRPSVFEAWIQQSKGDQVLLSRADRKFIVAQAQLVQDNVLARLRGIYADGWDGHPHPAALTHLADDLAGLHQAVAHIQVGPVDMPALAKTLTDQLGPIIGTMVADELHRRLGH